MRPRPLTIVLAVALSLAFAGCGAEDSPQAGSPPAETVETVERTKVGLYFTRGHAVGTAHRLITAEPGEEPASALEALLAGPIEPERAAGLDSEIPAATTLRELSVDANGLATVDLSGAFASGGSSLSLSMRAAQIVYTLTQFSGVERVRFALDGEPVEALGADRVLVDPPVGRSDFEDVTPQILVESPAVGDAVSSPLRASGTANTFEATFIVQLVGADGRTIAEDFVTATSGSGERGTFEFELPFTIPGSEEGTLVVFESSAKDGSPLHRVEIPLRLEAG